MQIRAVVSALIVAPAICGNAVSVRLTYADSPVPVQETDSVDSQTETEGHTDSENERQLSSQKVDRIVLNTIDEIIAISRTRGDAEQVSIWTDYRKQYSADKRSEYAISTAVGSYKLACFLRAHDELLTAHRFSPHLLAIAEFVKNDKPDLFMAAHQEVAMLDLSFERYDSALRHMSIALKIIEDNEIDRRLSFPCRANHAMVLRKLKRYDKAEQLYKELLEESKTNSEGLTEDAEINLRFALAALYAEEGRFLKYRATIPTDNAELYNTKGEFVENRAATMVVGSLKVHLSVGGDLAVAEKNAQEFLEYVQRNHGASSVLYIEAAEMLAKVYIAQDRTNEAAALLSRIATVRSGLFGETHPSVARVRDEAKKLRK